MLQPGSALIALLAVAGAPTPWPTAMPAEMGLDSAVLDGDLTRLLGDSKTGAAALAVGGKLVWEHYWDGFGPRSRLDTYSAGKADTATAIGLLMDDGKLKVDDPACKYLPEWAGDGRTEITIRQLLTMTSGLKLGCGRRDLVLTCGRVPARELLLGAAPFGETVLMWWNFVARTTDEILAAPRRTRRVVADGHPAAGPQVGRRNGRRKRERSPVAVVVDLQDQRAAAGRHDGAERTSFE